MYIALFPIGLDFSLTRDIQGMKSSNLAGGPVLLQPHFRILTTGCTNTPEACSVFLQPAELGNTLTGLGELIWLYEELAH